jgi:crotonobetainyl-CoA:carnitine CoA-transferase CaiB-like acyl-CoA transferase
MSKISPHPLQSLIDEQIPGPLNGTVIIDFARHIPGPLAATLLENLGALVIRCESRSGGDPLRYSILNGMDKVTIDMERKKYKDQALEQDEKTVKNTNDGQNSVVEEPTQTLHPINPHSVYTLLHKYKTHIIMFDLEKEHEIDLFHSLLSISDVLIESYRPGVFYNIVKLTPYQFSTQFPNLIVSSFTGFGQSSQEPGHDLNFVSQSGMIPRFIPNHIPILTQFDKNLSISSNNHQIPSKSLQIDQTPGLYSNNSSENVQNSQNDQGFVRKELLQPLSTLSDFPQLTPLSADPLQIVNYLDYLREFQKPLALVRNFGTGRESDHNNTQKSAKKRPTFPTLAEIKSCYPVAFHDMKQPLRVPGMPSGLIGDCTGTLIGVNAILAQLFGRQKEHIFKQKVLASKNPNPNFLDISLTSSPLIHVASFDIGVPLGNGPVFFLNFELSGHFANYTIYQTLDGYITVAAVEGKFWGNIVDLLGLEGKYGISPLLPPSVPIFPPEVFHSILKASMNNTTDKLPQHEQLMLSKLLYNEYLKTVLQYEFIHQKTQYWIEIFAKKPSCITPVINASEAYGYNSSSYAKMGGREDKEGIYTDCSAVLPIHPTKTSRIFGPMQLFDPPGVGKDQERVVGLLDKFRFEAKL